MMINRYTNFVRPEPPKPLNSKVKLLTGEEASKLYLEEIKANEDFVGLKIKHCHPESCSARSIRTNHNTSEINLFVTVQNNDVDSLKRILDRCPDKVNTIDEFGWSLLMIACQANSIETVEELLKHGADITIRDRAGNSAQNLVIKNKNYILADMLLNYKNKPEQKTVKEINVKPKDVFTCDVCNKMFPDREEHLSSTIHNISASRGKKITACYGIPQSNRGFQIMVKSGWDKDSGLGRDGSGKKYPIKTVQKLDRKGLGHKKKKIEVSKQDAVKHKNNSMMNKNYNYNKMFEINFRREFY